MGNFANLHHLRAVQESGLTADCRGSCSIPTGAGRFSQYNLAREIQAPPPDTFEYPASVFDLRDDCADSVQSCLPIARDIERRAREQLAIRQIPVTSNHLRDVTSPP